MKKLVGKVYRDKDGYGREFILVGKKIVRLFGDFDCMYQYCNLVDVKTLPWRGNLPQKPFQYLGFIEGKDVDLALEMNGKKFSSGKYHIS